MIETKEMKPKISIITITYNSKRFVEEAILSVLSQDYHNLEYIIVDGGSTDGTLDIVRAYCDKGSAVAENGLKHSIAKVLSEPDEGISDAFNKGIALASGDVVGIINSDDKLLPGALSAIASHYDASVDIYRSNIIIWNEETDARFKEVPSMTFPLIPLSIHVAHQGTFVSANCYRQFGGFDKRMKFCMDRDFLLRCYRGGAKFLYVDSETATYRMGGATSSAISKKRNDYLLLITKNGGSCLQAEVFYLYMCMREVVKSAISIFGSDAKRMLRYKKVESR